MNFPNNTDIGHGRQKRLLAAAKINLAHVVDAYHVNKAERCSRNLESTHGRGDAPPACQNFDIAQFANKVSTRLSTGGLQ